MSAQYEFNDFVATFIEGFLENHIEDAIGAGVHERNSPAHILALNALKDYSSELNDLLEATKDA